MFMVTLGVSGYGRAACVVALMVVGSLFFIVGLFFVEGFVSGIIYVLVVIRCGV